MQKTTSLPAGIEKLKSGKGLRIRVFAHGRTVYSESIACNPNTKTSIKMAKARRDKLVQQLRLGIPLVKHVEPGRQLVQDAIQDYLAVLQVKDSTKEEYVHILEHVWLPAFKNFLLCQVGRMQIRRVLAGLDVSPKRMKNLLTPLRGVFALAEISPNPCDGIPIRRQQKVPVERYSPAERDKLLTWLRLENPSTASQYQHAYFSLLFATGLRPCGEPLALQWSDYDGEYLNISKQMTKRKLRPYTKTSVVRKVYVPSHVRPIINSLPSRFKKGYIFMTKGGKHYTNAGEFNRAWRAAHEALGIAYRDPYKCRHTRASELLSRGVDPARAAQQLGHSVQMFLSTYAVFIEEYADFDTNSLEGRSPSHD